jgi:hypothetical protein
MVFTFAVISKYMAKNYVRTLYAIAVLNEKTVLVGLVAHASACGFLAWQALTPTG